MAKSILGVDVGSETLKLALVVGNQVRKAVAVPMPKNLVQDGRVISTETMGELIREAMQENGIHAQAAAYVLSNESVFVRNVVMPRMTAEQLLYNIPYEFNDYITDDLKGYVFDYAMHTTLEELRGGTKNTGKAPDAEGDSDAAQEPSDNSDEEEAPEADQAADFDEDEELSAFGESMELMAVAAPASLIDDARDMLRKAGLRLVRAAPTVSAYISLIRAMDGPSDREYCVLDLGYQAIRMYMFRGDRHVVTRVLEVGLSNLDSVVADYYNVDIHLAHTYLQTNYDDCHSKEFCVSAYNNIAVELMRALNFYRFSNPDSRLEDVWLCGGGAVIPTLRAAIADTLDMKVHPAAELLPDGGFENCNSFVQAVGITMD